MKYYIPGTRTARGTPRRCPSSPYRPSCACRLSQPSHRERQPVLPNIVKVMKNVSDRLGMAVTFHFPSSMRSMSYV